MKTETVRVDWVTDQLFLLRDRYNFPIVMAQPNGVNGADLLPLSLAGCAAWDIITILQKQRQQITNLEVIAESERDEQPPWRYRKICIHYRFAGQNLKAVSVKRAIELTESKYCSIWITLRDAIEIESDFEI